MVTQKRCAREKENSFYKNDSEFAISVDLNKCLNQIK